MNPVPEWADSFGKQVSHGISNSVDIPSHHPFSNERLRYAKNGSRVLDPGTDATFTDREQDWFLEPTAGDRVELFSAERPRYIVGTDAAASLAGRVESSLGSGDTLRFGLSDRQSPVNRAYFEVNGDSPNRVVTEAGGTETQSQEWTYPNGVDETSTIRYEVEFNWYGVGPYKFKITYTDDSQDDGEKTNNKVIAELTIGDRKLTNDANAHIFQEVDATNSGVQYIAGSMGYLIYGGVSSTERTKRGRVVGATDNYGGSGDYEPILAFRVDPPRGNVFSQLVNFEVIPDGGSGQATVNVFDSSQTDASGFSTPNSQSKENSVIETTTSVSTFEDIDGNSVTSDPNPDGYQIGFYGTDVTGLGSASSRMASAERTLNPLYEGDVAIVLYKADTATARTVNTIYTTKQLW